MKLFLDDVPLLDVRAPVEYVQGAFPNVTNIPLLDDDQREQIGIRYKKEGQEKAIELGLELATVDIRAQRLGAWVEFYRNHPEAHLYCFRGGLRSRTTQSWLRDQGVDIPLISGGYKAMRRFLLDELEISARQIPLVIVSGLTGSGKTRVLRKISHHIDLEGLASHRGSAFGRNASDSQPTVINWENRLSIEFLKHRHLNPSMPVFIEDEGRRIGRVGVPNSLYKSMLGAPRAILEVDIESRIQLINEDYIESAWPQYQTTYSDDCESQFSRYILDNLARIQKRLGGEKYHQVKGSFESALKDFFTNQRSDGFNEGIKILLKDYYDPMYRYQLASKQVDILFQGPEQAYLEWAEDYLAKFR